RLVSSSSQHRSAGGLDRSRCLKQLFARFDRTGSGHHNDVFSPDQRAAGIHNRVIAFDLATHELERVCDGNDVRDAGRSPQSLQLGAPPVASHRAYDGALSTTNHVRPVAASFYALDDVVDLFFSGVL